MRITTVLESDEGAVWYRYTSHLPNDRLLVMAIDEVVELGRLVATRAVSEFAEATWQAGMTATARLASTSTATGE